MIDNIYDISGRHLNSDELNYVITERCKDIGLEVLEIINPISIKKSSIKFICKNCKEENFRNSYAVLTYRLIECKKCSDFRKQGRFKRIFLDKESLQEIINEKYKDRNFCFNVVEEFVYINNKQVIKVECLSCGAKVESRIDLLKQGKKSCKCNQVRSKLEAKVKNILENNNISYEKEYSFSDLRHIQPLRYDYVIFKEDKLFLIECDGIQHFYPTFGKVSYERTIITDNIKNEYAKNKNIPLLRIPYNTKESIEELILEFINL